VSPGDGRLRSGHQFIADYQNLFSANPVRRGTLRRSATDTEAYFRDWEAFMQQSIKMRAILAAGAALVAAGALAGALAEEKTGTGTAPIVSSGGMTIGDTATTTTSPTAVPIASPALKATVPCGFTTGC
jgi:hypothetical protein